MPTTVFHDSSLSFMPQPWSSSQQYQTQQFYSFSAGNASSPGSSSSASSTSSSFNENSNSPLRSPDTTTLEDVTGGGKPYMQIIEQPSDKFRFRYRTEMQGTHGAILGANNHKSRTKTFPRVKLCGYKPNKSPENPIIRCTLYTADDDESKRIAHVHRLVGKVYGEEKEDPHDVVVSAPQYVAEFPQMTILFTKKEDQVNVLLEKKKTHLNKRFTDGRRAFFPNMSQLHTVVQDELSTMNLNVACLRFDALINNGQGMYTPLCPPVYSRPISNMKNPKTNELKICRVDRCMGPCDGGQEVFIFVEKVIKKDIKVKFYEEDDNKDVTWSADAEFSPDDVHHQYGIAFRTPPYWNLNIKDDVTVYFQLERPSDHAVSEPRSYIYNPNTHRIRDITRKRPRQDSDFPTSLLDFQQPRPPSVANNPPPPRYVPPQPAPDADSSSLLGLNCGGDGDLLTELFDLQDVLKLDEALGGIQDDGLIENIPSGDSELISQLISSDRFHEYAALKGFSEADLRLISAQEITSSIQEERMVFDGVCGVAESRKETKAPDAAQTSSGTQTTFVTEMLGETFRSSRAVELSATKGNLDKIKERAKMDENNIVEKTDNTLNNILKLEKSGKMNDKRLRTSLRLLFSFQVGEAGDRVLHVLAACEKLPAEAVKFINVLKTHDDITEYINRENNKRETPLHVAARRGSVEMISLLLQSGADINAKDHQNNTALHLAVMRGPDSLKAITAMLWKHPALDVCNEEGYTVLHLAVKLRKSDVISALLMKTETRSFQADLINKKDGKLGNTALHIAVHYKFKEIVKLLLSFEEHIDVNAKNFCDKTPLAFVWEETDEDSKEITNLLISCKADPSLVTMAEEEPECKSVQEIKECKDEDDSESVLEIVDVQEDDMEEKLSLYAEEWEDCALFDTLTVAKLCPLLDQHGDWSTLVKKLNYSKVEVEHCSNYWSPTLMAFKVARYKYFVTPEIIRDQLLAMSPRLRLGAQYIDDMLLKNHGL